MTRDDIIEAASKAGFETKRDMIWVDQWEITPTLTRFAALVAAAERDRMIADGWRQCAQGQRTTQFCGMVEQARQEEREACAQILDRNVAVCGNNTMVRDVLAGNALAIRARGTISAPVTDRFACYGILDPDEDNPSF